MTVNQDLMCFTLPNRSTCKLKAHCNLPRYRVSFHMMSATSHLTCIGIPPIRVTEGWHNDSIGIKSILESQTVTLGVAYTGLIHYFPDSANARRIRMEYIVLGQSNAILVLPMGTLMRDSRDPVRLYGTLTEYYLSAPHVRSRPSILP